ncbi:MAG TPA: DNA topoisomerase (ATP-hydrolyzing), partial [Anaerolineales bacterium]|nr:DNA topoisomerase (ATP-hydrolyzing) [Anaerolineales bacterium]
MELGLVQKINIDDEMQQAYLDYAMSVIVARALPDARDGLKPVHRRILYAMYDMGLRADSTFKKSARIVGEVMGKYHPHGDMTVYDAMARMAQDFSMRCVLVDGQGNFGSMDGDPPAAMRYTEARLTPAALEMLRDITRETVDFDANFDDTLSEPTVLPAAIPNLLVNGATGIAVGMSTSIPPHNLGEVVDALKYLLAHWERLDDINLEDLMGFIKGPDFPTGGVIIQESGEETLASAYGSGRGRLTVQARAHLEEMERGRNRVIVTELPYMTNKSSLIERIALLAREERIEGIADLRDESDRQGMRIVIELNRAADPEAVLRDLYRHTPMQSTFSLIMLALVDGEPRLLSLKQALRVYLDHRLEIIRRRSEHDLARARQRAHILEGLRVALKHLDEVISLIRQAADADAARLRLIKRFKLSDAQAQAILDMQLRRLASLERKKIELEYKETLALIKELEALLRSPKKMRQVAADELEAVKQAYGDRRRTQIVSLKKGEQRRVALTAGDLLPEGTVWLSATADGLLARTLEDKIPRQSGGEAPAWLLRVNTRDTLYLAAQDGSCAALPLHAIPEAEKPSDGVPHYKVSPLTPSDKLAALFTLPPKGERAEGWYVMTVSRQGMVKKTALGELPGPSANTFTLVRVNAGDSLGWARLTNGEADVLLLSAQGMAIRFSEEQVRPMGLVAAGVSGMKLQAGDEVVGAVTLPASREVFMVASDGSAKRVAVSQFPQQGRYGQGVLAWKLPARVKAVGLTSGKGTQRVTLHLDKLAPKMARLDEAPLQGRASR